MGATRGSHSVALVTGASGLIGSHIVARLLADGWSVRALSRDPDTARLTIPRGDEIEIAPGDVLDEASFARAAQGAHVIFHAAANIIVSGGWDAYRVTNVDGTRNALIAAERAHARLLHVSSVAVYGGSARYDAARRGGRTDEQTPLVPLPQRAFYARSKREAEDLVFRAHREGRVWAAAIRPDVVYGRRDRQFVPRIAKLMRTFPVPLLNGGRSIMAIVHAANVADGAVLAATTDVAGGKAYNLANDFDVSVREFFELAGQGLGRKPIFLPMPLWAARGALRTIKSAAKVVTGGRYSLVSQSAIDFIAEDNPFSSELAKQELHWSPQVRPAVGVPEAFAWARRR